MEVEIIEVVGYELGIDGGLGSRPFHREGNALNGENKVNVFYI